MELPVGYPSAGCSETPIPTYLSGDLVSRVISKVTLVLSTYNPNQDTKDLIY